MSPLRYWVVIVRTLLTALTAGAFIVSGIPVLAASPAPPPTATPAALNAAHPETIEGIVEEVNYSKNILKVKTSKGVVNVAVLPSTSIQICKAGSTKPADCQPGFYAISDIKKNAKVRVLGSQVGDELRAQLITIWKESKEH